MMMWLPAPELPWRLPVFPVKRVLVAIVSSPISWPGKVLVERRQFAAKFGRNYQPRPCTPKGTPPPENMFTSYHPQKVVSIV